jgi:hypothetical protein
MAVPSTTRRDQRADDPCLVCCMILSLIGSFAPSGSRRIGEC